MAESEPNAPESPASHAAEQSDEGRAAPASSEANTATRELVEDNAASDGPVKLPEATAASGKPVESPDDAAPSSAGRKVPSEPALSGEPRQLAGSAQRRSERPAAPRSAPETRVRNDLLAWPPTRATLQVAGVAVLALGVTTFSTLQFLRAPSTVAPNPTPLNPPALNPTAFKPAAPSSAPSAVSNNANTPLATATPQANAGALPDVPMPTFDEEGEPKPPAPVRIAPQINTVHEAALNSCTTESIEALNRQLVEQARCLDPKAFAAIPSRPNLKFGPGVFPYLNSAARDHLLDALKSRPGASMTINSALRTLAQQYLVSRWADGGRCGVQMALAPGESHHESGLALDVASPQEWRKALENNGFHWLGAADRAHFDFEGDRKGAAKSKSASESSAKKARTDVLAFQQLWNRNHPDDAIAANGRYSAETESRLELAPVRGFESVPACGSGRKNKASAVKL